MLPFQSSLLRLNYVKILLLSFGALLFGVLFAGVLMPKIIRMAMKMVRQSILIDEIVKFYDLKKNFSFHSLNGLIA